MWFRLLSAKEIIDVDLNDIFMKEVDILASSSHLNFIKYYYTTKINTNKNSESSIMNNLRKKYT